MATRMVVFDLPGTTLRDERDVASSALHDALDRYGVTLRPGAIDGVAGMGQVEAIRILLEGHGRDDLLAQSGAIGADVISRLQRHYQVPGNVAAVPGCDAVFARLRSAGVRIAIGTTMPPSIVGPLCAQLRWNAGGGSVDAVITGDDVPRSRPYPDMIDALRHRFGDIAPAEVIKVGGTPIDLQEGTMAGCGLVIGVAASPRSRERLMVHPHDAIIDGIAALPALLASRGLRTSDR